MKSLSFMNNHIFPENLSKMFTVQSDESVNYFIDLFAIWIQTNYSEFIVADQSIINYSI